MGTRALSSFFLSNRKLAWLAAAIVFIALCFRLGQLPLLAPDEGRNAEIGREMKESGAWLVPTYNGVDCLDKPAFFFRTVALSLTVFGNNQTAARLPSDLFGLALLLMTFAFCRKVYGTHCALLAAIVIASTPLYLANARTVIFDMPLAFFVCGAIFAGYLAEASDGKHRRAWYALGAASAGIATLVKGPVGFLLPALVLLAFNRVEGRRDAWKRLLKPVNLAVVFAIPLPWFIGLCLSHPDFLRYGLVEESFHRFTSAKTFHRAEPWYFYILIVAAAFFPWSLLLPEGGVAAWKERWAKNSADRLCIVWSIVVIAFFSISQSKLPGYILSVTVACGILAARVFDAALTTRDGKASRLVRRATLFFGLTCLLAVLVGAMASTQVHPLAKMLHISEVDARQFIAAARPLAILGATLGVAAAIAYYRRNVGLGFLCLALFLPLTTIAGHRACDVVFEAKSGWRLVEAMPALPPDTEVACLECFPNGLPFYLGRTVTLVSQDGHELGSNYIMYHVRHDGPPKQIVPCDEFDAWLTSRKTPVYLITRKADQEKLHSLALARHAKIQTLSPGYFGAQLMPNQGS